MSSQFMTLYVLFLPLVATMILFVICMGVYKDIQEAKISGEDLL